MTSSPKPLRCYHGSATDAELDQLVADGRLAVGDADAIREFRDFLKAKVAKDGSSDGRLRHD